MIYILWDIYAFPYKYFSVFIKPSRTTRGFFMSILGVDSMIYIKNLDYSYKVYKKSHGIKGSLKDFFNRKYKLNNALLSINLEIKKGEIVGLLGSNGAGKTTLIKILSGLIEPNRGKVEVLGFNPGRKEKDFLKNLGVVFGQKSQLIWDLPSIDTFYLLKEIYKIDNEDFHNRLKYLSRELEVERLINVPVRKLSLGERMKCELIASLIHNPKLLILDEPTIGLDVRSQRAIHSFLKKVNKEINTTIILTSHYTKDIEAVCNRIVLLSHGEIKYDDSIDKFLKKYNKDMRTIKVSTELKEEKLFLESIGFVKLLDGKYKIEVERKDFKNKLEELMTNTNIVDISIEEIELEDILYKIFTKDKAGDKVV